MKKLVSFMFCVCLLFAFCVPAVSCAALQTQLEAPTNVRLDGTVLKWNSVDNAKGYMIFVDGNELVGVSATLYDLSNAELKEGKEYSVTVKARGDGKLYTTSEHSAAIIYTHTAAEGEKGDPLPDSHGSDAKKIIQDYSLGAGIDAITATYLDVTHIKRNDLFDFDKVAEAFPIDGSTSLGTGKLNSISENSMTTFCSEFASKYSHSSSSSLGLDSAAIGIGFSTTIKNKFSISTELNITADTQQLYYMSYQSIADSRRFLRNFNPGSVKSGEYLSQYAIADLDNILNLTGERQRDAIASFFNTYGTHIITSATYGGKIEIYYHFVSNSMALDSTISTSLKTSLEASVNYGPTSGGASSTDTLNSKLHSGTSNKDTSAQFSVSYAGGKAISTYSFSDFADDYKDWIKDYNERTEHKTMIDIDKEGLCPVWDFLPEKYIGVAAVMKDYFAEKLAEANNEWLSKFSPSPEIEVEDTVNFAGGTGAKDNPYVITSKKHLDNVRNNLDKHFVLGKNIDLDGVRWNPIGHNNGEYSAFTGSLDGDGYAIKN